MTCPDPLLGKSLVWSVDENIWLWRFWRSTTGYSRYQSIVLHFGLLLQSSILLGHHLGNIHLSAKKGKRKWSYRSVSYPSIEGSRALRGNNWWQRGTNAKQQQRNWDSKKYRFETEIFCWGLQAGQDDSASRWALQELLSRTGAGLHHKKLFLWEEILARNVRNTLRWKTPLQRVFIVGTCSLS